MDATTTDPSGSGSQPGSRPGSEPVLSDDDIEQRIREFFEANFETLRLEGDRSLAPDVKDAAFQQVLLYWRKLKDIALKVTDTEVKLTLPEQRSPKGRHFGIEGVVDIVREQGRTVLYDIKTHAAAAIRADPEPYEKQLNIYAYIWQNLRGQQLDETAVICTNFPEAIEQALQLRDEVALERELARWEPVIPFDFDANHVSETIREFGEVVDRIEDGDFAPPPAMFLESKLPNMRSVFAARVCVNCDARYSCASYRTYAQKARGHSGKIFRAYLEDVSTDTEREQRATALLDATPTAEELQSLTAQTQE